MSQQLNGTLKVTAKVHQAQQPQDKASLVVDARPMAKGLPQNMQVKL